MTHHDDLPDFDTLLALHRHDPTALDRLQRKLSSQLVQHAPDSTRRRLQGLQFRINMELERAGSPEARYQRLSHLMYESLAELNQCLNDPSAALRRLGRRNGSGARVIPLDSGKNSH